MGFGVWGLGFGVWGLGFSHTGSFAELTDPPSLLARCSSGFIAHAARAVATTASSRNEVDSAAHANFSLMPAVKDVAAFPLKPAWCLRAIISPTMDAFSCSSIPDRKGSDILVSSHTNFVQADQCPSYTLLVFVATDVDTKAERVDLL